MGIADIERAMATRAYACDDFELTFVNVRNRDDYGKRDFRNLASIASMGLSVQDLDPLGGKIRQHQPKRS